MCNNLYNSVFYCDTIIPECYKYFGSDSMSITIGIIGENGIVTATDSLRTSFNPRNISQDYAKKLWVWNDSFVVMVMGSNTRYSDWLVNSYEKERLNDLSDYDDILRDFSLYITNDFKIHRIDDSQNKDDPNDIMFFIFVGYDKNGDARITQLDSSKKDMPFIPKPVESPHIISFDNIGLYWLGKLKYHNWAVESLMKLVVFLINESSKQEDHMVGGDIQLAIIKSNKAEMVNKQVINKITETIDNCIDINSMEKVFTNRNQ